MDRSAQIWTDPMVEHEQEFDGLFVPFVTLHCFNHNFVGSCHALESRILESEDVVGKFIERRVAMPLVNRVHRSQAANQGRLIHTKNPVETKATIP